MTREAAAPDVLGAWRLVDFTISFEDGARALKRPMGARAEGMIVYSAEGRVSAVLSSEDRALLSCTRLEDAHQASDDEKARAFDTYLSYVGRYRFEGDEVVHTIELALVPNVVGSEQRRRWALHDGQLVLSYDVAKKSGARTYALTWERCS